MKHPEVVQEIESSSIAEKVATLSRDLLEHNSTPSVQLANAAEDKSSTHLSHVDLNKFPSNRKGRAL